MTNETEKEDLIMRYFFGELDEEAKDCIEQQFLSDNQFFEQMLSIEEALIDDYVRGRLGEREHKKVEEFLQCAHRRDREINLVERLVGDLAKTRSANSKEKPTIRVARPSRRRFWQGAIVSGRQFSLALALLLAVSGLVLAIWTLVLQHNKLSQMEARYAELEARHQELVHRLDSQADSNTTLAQRMDDLDRKRDQTDQEINTIRESRSTTSANDTVTLALTMQALTKGGGESKVVRIGPGVNWLQIGVDVGEGDFNSYNATIETFEGRRVWSKDGVKPARANSGKVVVTLPARLFANEDYTLALKGRKNDGSTIDIGEFSFRVKE